MSETQLSPGMAGSGCLNEANLESFSFPLSALCHLYSYILSPREVAKTFFNRSRAPFDQLIILSGKEVPLSSIVPGKSQD